MRPIVFITGIAVGTTLSAVLVTAWTGPTALPPNGNVPAPINVGAIDQIKIGGIGAGSLAVFGNAILSTTNGYLNFGPAVGFPGYGFRDNGGTMEYKDNGGSWTSFASLGGGGAGGNTGSNGTNAVLQYQTGMWCGYRAVSCGSNIDETVPTYYPAAGNISCLGAPITVACNGLVTDVNCPSGFTGLITGDTNTYHGSGFYQIVTCLKN